jgi:GntR family transcriptional regulator, transcriptional repressor for pyruvate dehydrogenase complex
MFRHAKQSRAFEDIVSQIQEAILQGKLKPDDKLPSERNLREIFDVSRGTLREALRALEQKRLVTIKTGVGGGAFVNQVDARQVSDSLELLLQYQKISLEELAEFREAVEGLVAGKAARRVKKQDLTRLKSYLESIRNHLETADLRWDEVMKEDNHFHLGLVQIAGNRIFESILFTIYENINRYFQKFLPRDRRILEGIYQDLCRIYEAIEAKDSHRASLLVQGHLKRFNQMMKRGEKKR